MTSRTVQLSFVTIIAVALSIALIVFGLPEQTPAQTLALELGSLPLSVALAAGDLMLLDRAKRQPSTGARRGLIGGGVVSAIGLALMAFAYLTGPRGLVQFGQFVVFVGLLIVLLIAISLQVSSETEWFHLDEVADNVIGPDDAAAEEHHDRDADPDAAGPTGSL